MAVNEPDIHTEVVTVGQHFGFPWSSDIPLKVGIVGSAGNIGVTTFGRTVTILVAVPENAAGILDFGNSGQIRGAVADGAGLTIMDAYTLFIEARAPEEGLLVGLVPPAGSCIELFLCEHAEIQGDGGAPIVALASSRSAAAHLVIVVHRVHGHG